MQKRLWVIFSLIFTLHLSNCRERTNPCSLSKDVLIDIETLDSLIGLPEIRQRDKTLMMNNFNEPSILIAKTESSFGGTEINRIEEINGYYKLTKKVFANHQDTIGIITEFEIPENDWNNIVNSLAAYNFWTYPYSDKR